MLNNYRASSRSSQSLKNPRFEGQDRGLPISYHQERPIMSSMESKTSSGDSMHFHEPVDEQLIQNEVSQMDLAPLSRTSSQQPVIEFAIVDDSESDAEVDDYVDEYDEYGFFSDVVTNVDEEEWNDSDDTWSNSSSDSGETNWLDIYGGWRFSVSSWKYVPFYRFVKPRPRTSCNAAAAALKEPISLLTKYSHQRLGHKSKYFEESIPSPSEALREGRQVTRGSRLRIVENLDD